MLFEWRPARLAARKCAPGKYPPRASVLREVRRSTVSVVIAWAMDLAVMHGLDRGLRGKLELAPEAADGRSNGWLPSLDELQARGWSLLPLVLVLVLWGDAHFYFSHRYARARRALRCKNRRADPALAVLRSTDPT